MNVKNEHEEHEQNNITNCDTLRDFQGHFAHISNIFYMNKNISYERFSSVRIYDSRKCTICTREMYKNFRGSSGSMAALLESQNTVAMQHKRTSGNASLDTFLNGGYDSDIITTIYGPSGAGKTTLCLLAAVQAVRSNKKVIYIDTEASFSVERLIQIAPEDYTKILEHTLFLRPMDFADQQKAFDKLCKLVDSTIGLIVVDTISMLYRLEIGQTNDIYNVNKKLGRQLAALSEIARREKVPILVVNQVYANFEDKDKVNMVGGDILRYSSKTLLELQILAQGQRLITVRKSRSLPEGKMFSFKLIHTGIEERPQPTI